MRESYATTNSEYIDATQLEEVITEIQLNENHKKQVTHFLMDSWANMSELEKNEDDIDFFPDKDFQLVTAKKKKNIKSKSTDHIRHKSSVTNISL